MTKLATVHTGESIAQDESSLENGDIFVADTGEYIGKWEGEMKKVPVEICMIVDEYEYVYKLDRREPGGSEA